MEFLKIHSEQFYISYHMFNISFSLHLIRFRKPKNLPIFPINQKQNCVYMYGYRYKNVSNDFRIEIRLTVTLSRLLLVLTTV